jgi:hypothetical protein
MLNIYVSYRTQNIITNDGHPMTVREVYVRDNNQLLNLNSCESFPALDDIEITLIGRFFTKKLCLSKDTCSAILTFLSRYHAKQDVTFDCYAFANLMKNVPLHRVPHMLTFWEIKRKPWRIPCGSVVFLTSGRNRFHHAAIYIGANLYISVYGAGGDLEIATLADMRRDYRADCVFIAFPKST